MPTAIDAAALRDTIAAILGSGWQAVLVGTGGGSGAMAALLQTPGASRVVLEAAVPYCAAALTEWLAAPPEQSCSSPTARAMAMAAWQRARRLAPEAEPHKLVGIGCTASLASDRPKRGAHRIHVAVQTADRTSVASLELSKGARSRPEEESAVTALVLDELAAATTGAEARLANPLLVEGEAVMRESAAAPQAVADVVCGRAELALCDHGTWLAAPRAASELANSTLFPGAFNPLHEGHRQMATLAAARTGGRVVYEIAVVNVDKPPLDYLAIAQRVAQFPAAVVAITRAATFVEKARLFPDSLLVVGADTIQRIGEPRYYDDDPAVRNAAIAEIERLGCRFLVFGRATDNCFQSLADLALPPALAAICTGVSANEFRKDVSSTALRQRGPAESR